MTPEQQDHIIIKLNGYELRAKSCLDLVSQYDALVAELHERIAYAESAKAEMLAAHAKLMTSIADCRTRLGLVEVTQ